MLKVRVFLHNLKYILTRVLSEVRSLECQHLETMRSTQAALLEAKSELQEFVQVTTAAFSIAAS